jgi:hypothetical protein
MVSDAGQLVDHLGHPRRGPQGRGKPVGLRAFFKGALQMAELAGSQTGFTPGTPGLFQSLASPACPSHEPAIGGLAVDAKFAGNFGLAQTPVKESGRRETTLFKLLKVPFDAFWITHAPKIS